MSLSQQKVIDNKSLGDYNVFISQQKWGEDMSEREKEIVKKLSNTIPKLDKEKQSYLLGVAEGMALTRETETKKENEEE